MKFLSTILLVTAPILETTRNNAQNITDPSGNSFLKEFGRAVKFARSKDFRNIVLTVAIITLGAMVIGAGIILGATLGAFSAERNGDSYSRGLLKGAMIGAAYGSVGEVFGGTKAAILVGKDLSFAAMTRHGDFGSNFLDYGGTTFSVNEGLITTFDSLIVGEFATAKGWGDAFTVIGIALGVERGLDIGCDPNNGTLRKRMGDNFCRAYEF